MACASGFAYPDPGFNTGPALQKSDRLNYSSGGHMGARKPSPYPIIDEARAMSHEIPMGVTLGPCAFCPDPIVSHDDATVYQQTANGPALMAHKGCAANNLQRIVRAMGKYGPGRLGAALRLDR